MSNKHNSKQHGLTSMNATRPKSKLRKRRNKAKAKVRKEVLLKALSDAVKTKSSKKPKAASAKE